MSERNKSVELKLILSRYKDLNAVWCIWYCGRNEEYAECLFALKKYLL